MRSAALVACFVAFGAGLGAGVRVAQAAPAGEITRAYFRAETQDARRRLALYAARELPGGIVSVALPAAALSTLSSTPGLAFIGQQALFEPVPITGEALEAAAGPAEVGVAAARTCFRPGFMPQVGWGIKAMYDDPSLVRPSGGSGVKVGVIDTGVAPHPDIVRRLAACADFTETPIEVLPPCADSMNHGTSVATVIAADGGADGLGLYGMAPEVAIHSYRACNPDRECWGAYVAAAIYAAIDDGVNIINLSLASAGQDEVVKAAIAAAVARNILVVAAVGNSPPYSYISYPAAHSEVVSVAAITESRAPWPYSAPGHNDGDYVREPQEIEVSAPGASIAAGLKNGCYWLGNGTSLAAPMVSGLAAKLWNGDAADLRRRIQASARFHDLYVAGDDTLTGYGLPTTTPVFRVMATSTAGGVVSPSGPVMVLRAGTQAFTITPIRFASIQDVEVDGVSVGPVSSYRFDNVAADHSIHVRFSTKEVALSLPSPNPARGAMRLRFGMPEAGPVRLSVLDLQGREVAVLASGTQSAGWSWAEWNGETREGRAAGGVYFARLQAGSRQVVHRFAFIR